MVATLGIIVLSALFPVVVGSIAQCREVSVIDCDNNYTPTGDERVCSSDFKDCPNLCHFAKKKCENPSLTILNSGPCVPKTTDPPMANLTTIKTTTLDPPLNSTTITPAEDLTTALPAQEQSTESTTDDVIHKVFCSNAGNITCPKELDPLCGTDGKFYTNDCEFAKAKCKNNNLQIQELALCKAAHRHKRQLAFV